MSHTKLAGVFLVFVTAFCLRCQGSEFYDEDYDNIEIITDYDDDQGEVEPARHEVEPARHEVEPARHNCDTETETALAEMKSEIQSLQQLVVGLRQKLDQDFKLPPSLESKCPPGFQYVSLARSCYKVVYEEHNWTSADQRCHDLHPGSHLVAVTTEDKNTGLKAYMRQEASKNYWSKYRSWTNPGMNPWTSGQRLNETICTDDFVWKILNSTQLPLSFTNWHRGEPNCYENRPESCLQVRRDYGYQWNDQPCDTKGFPLCEYDPS